MKRFLPGCFGAVALIAAVAVGTTEADARDGRAFAQGLAGGLSAGAIVGGYPYYPGYPAYGYGYYPSYPAPAYTVAPLGPPPGCVIRQQRVWDGYRWRWQKLRICH